MCKGVSMKFDGKALRTAFVILASMQSFVFANAQTPDADTSNKTEETKDRPVLDAITSSFADIASPYLKLRFPKKDLDAKLPIWEVELLEAAKILSIGGTKSAEALEEMIQALESEKGVSFGVKYSVIAELKKSVAVLRRASTSALKQPEIDPADIEGMEMMLGKTMKDITDPVALEAAQRRVYRDFSAFVDYRHQVYTQEGDTPILNLSPVSSRLLNEKDKLFSALAEAARTLMRIEVKNPEEARILRDLAARASGNIALKFNSVAPRDLVSDEELANRVDDFRLSKVLVRAGERWRLNAVKLRLIATALINLKKSYAESAKMRLARTAKDLAEGADKLMKNLKLQYENLKEQQRVLGARLSEAVKEVLPRFRLTQPARSGGGMMCKDLLLAE